jgi:hypothetical protein
VSLSRDLETAGPDRQKYPAGSIGTVYKRYKNGVILEMSDGRKIPAQFSFLDQRKFASGFKIARGPIPKPYQTPL